MMRKVMKIEANRDRLVSSLKLWVAAYCRVSTSRFARNILDCLKYIRQLKDKGISVFFEKENINTMDSKGEVMLTIMPALPSGKANP